jgi:hypothetical protein
MTSNPTNPTHTYQEDYYPSYMGYGELIIFINMTSNPTNPTYTYSRGLLNFIHGLRGAYYLYKYEF